MWNSDRTAERPSVVVLFVERSSEGRVRLPLRQCEVIAPGVGVEVLVAENVIDLAVVRIGSALRIEAFDSAGGHAELGRQSRGDYLEFTERVHRRCGFVERRPV